MPGVYGDHAKEGGWNDRILNEHFARQRTKAEAKGDFGASGEIEFGLQMIEAGEAEGRQDTVDRGRAIINAAGALAAKEARFQGVPINGW